MNEIKQILDFIRRTNPEMTMEKLRQSLNSDSISPVVLGIMTKNVKRG